MLTVAQAAQQLGVSVNLVYALCATRRLRHERHGLGRGRIRIPEEALAEYRASRTVPARGEEPPAPAWRSKDPEYDRFYRQFMAEVAAKAEARAKFQSQ